MNPLNSGTSIKQAVRVSRCDRWQLYQRLQELSIPCECCEDGSLWVDIQDTITAVQLYSVVRQLTNSRQELVNWLNHCWKLRQD